MILLNFCIFWHVTFTYSYLNNNINKVSDRMNKLKYYIFQKIDFCYILLLVNNFVE